MIKEIKSNLLMPTSRELILSEMSGMVSKTVEMAEGFHAKFERAPIQQQVRQIIEESEVPQGEVLYILLYGSTGSGKSTSALGEITDLLLRFPGLKALFSRRTYVEIEDSIWPATQEFFNEYEVEFRQYKKNYELHLGNGSLIRMRSSERTATGKTNKAHGLGSTEYKAAIIEEADEQPQEFFDTVATRMRQQVAGLPFGVVFVICNPPDEDHWIHEFFFEDPENHPDDPKSYKRALHMPVEENPFVDEGYRRQLYRKFKDDPLLFEAFVKGRFAPSMKGDPVFHHSFNPAIHVSTTDISKSWDKDLPIQISVDFGFNRPAIIAAQDVPELNQLRVLDEALGKKVLLRPFLQRFMSRMARKYPGAKFEFYCDPAGSYADGQGRTAETAVDIMKEMGYPPRYKKSSIEYGLGVIQRMLGTLQPSRYGPVPGLLINCTCTTLIKAFEIGYCNEKDTPDGKVKPVKDGKFDHLMDVLRYMVIFLRLAGKEKHRMDHYGTREGRWNPVADGDPSQWLRQIRRAANTQYEEDFSGSKRRLSSRVTPSMASRESLW